MKDMYVVLINGVPRKKESAIRTYKTRERAEKESQWFVKHGYKVQVAEFSIVNITDVEELE